MPSRTTRRSRRLRDDDDDDDAPGDTRGGPSNAAAARRRRLRGADDDDDGPAAAVDEAAAEAVAERKGLLAGCGATFTAAHRLFVHTWLAVRFADDDAARRIYRDCVRRANAGGAPAAEAALDADFPAFVRVVNEYLGAVDLRIVSGAAPDSGKRHWALVNQVGDEIAQAATALSPSELAYFKRLIELTMHTGDGSFAISSMRALRESSAVKPPLSHKAAEDLIHRLAVDGWLAE
ncbi:hypothetical protein HK405_014376, partial [Cladochytrium tenue]